MARKRKKNNSNKNLPRVESYHDQFFANTFPRKKSELSFGNIGSGYGFPVVDPRSHFMDSLGGRCDNITLNDLRRISEVVIFDRAIEKICNGVCGLKWVIEPPEEKQDKPEALSLCSDLTKYLRRPNKHLLKTYELFISALIKDILVLGCGFVRRYFDENTNRFYLWALDPASIKINQAWKGNELEPRYWYCPKNRAKEEWEPLYESDGFIIQARSSSYELVPKSPVRLAYKDVTAWVELHQFQTSTTSNATRDFIIYLEEAGEDEIYDFRNYWRTEVIGNGEVPIIGGKVGVVKFGAKGDSELYLQFTDYLTNLLALYFGLNHRDVNTTGQDSYATASIAHSQAFQEAILPIANKIIQMLHFEVIDYYFEGYTLRISDAEPTRESEEAQRASQLYGANIVTRNESRRMVGEKPVENGDVFADGNKLGQETVKNEQGQTNEAKNKNDNSRSRQSPVS